jgi:Rha family phage regulatory protein
MSTPNTPKIRPYVALIHGEIRTTSLKVAEHFGRDHKNVLQSIENLGCSIEFTELNFQPSSYKDASGKLNPMFEMTRDGFTLLAMGFTGKEAMKWKEAYITAFNAMEAELQRQANEAVSFGSNYPPGQPSHLPPIQRVNANLLAQLDRRSKRYGDAYLVECGITERYVDGVLNKPKPKPKPVAGQDLAHDIGLFVDDWHNYRLGVPLQTCLALHAARLFRYWLKKEGCPANRYSQQDILSALLVSHEFTVTQDPRFPYSDQINPKKSVLVPPDNPHCYNFYGWNDSDKQDEYGRWLGRQVVSLDQDLMGLGV